MQVAKFVEADHPTRLANGVRLNIKKLMIEDKNKQEALCESGRT